MGYQDKDKWDKFKVITEFLIAIAAIGFSAIYNFRQQEIAEVNLELAKSNNRVSEVQVETALLPALLSEDPKQRSMALNLAKMLNESFASKAAEVLSFKDSDRDVRKTAASALKSLSQTASGETKEKANEAWNQYDNMQELQIYAVIMDLRAKGLLEKLTQAEGYLAGGNISGKEKASQLYRQVINELSPASRNKLDQKLLREAESDFKAGYIDDAARKYHALFTDYTG